MYIVDLAAVTSNRSLKIVIEFIYHNILLLGIKYWEKIAECRYAKLSDKYEANR